MTEIVISGLSKSFGSGPVIDDLSLTVPSGEFLTLLGPSGCGKTTTLRSVAGLERPDAGTITIGGTVVTSIAEGRNLPPNRRHLGMVFQSYAIWPHMSVFDNVAYPLRRRRLRGVALRTRVVAALESVGLEHAAERPATQLSGGQQQRVALARAMVGDPPVLLFDEPLSNLDAQLRVSMRDEIQRLRSADRTSVYVTHDQAEAFALSDRIAIMLDGAIVQLDTPRAVLDRPASVEVARFLGVENLLAGTVTTSTSTTAVVAVPSLGASLRADHDRRLPAGTPVTLGIRAGQVRLAGPSGSSNPVSGTVLTSTFLGEGAQLRLAVGTTHLLVSEAGDAGARAGDSVSVSLPPAAIRVFTS